MSKSITNINTGKELYKHVKAGFIAKDTSLTAWCRANELNPTNVRSALMGSWSGPGARKICIKLMKAAGVDSSRFTV